jgi:tRNA(Ile)-lysidine synthase
MPKYSQKSVIGKTRKTILENSLILPHEKIAVALSGGPDSVCLLNILFDLQEELNFELYACHFNHRLRGEASDADEKFVKKICQEKGIELLQGEAPENGLYKSEDEARAARYEFFSNILKNRKIDKIALGHNLNDSAETIIMRFIRGAGSKGLSSMPLARPGFIRPMLSVSREEIEAYLKNGGLPYCLDESNKDIKYSRNRIRHELLPELLKLNPNLLETLTNNARVWSDDFEFLKAEGESAFEKILVSKDGGEIVLKYQAWLKYPAALQRQIMRHCFELLETLQDVTSIQLLEVETMLKKGVGKKSKLLPHALQVTLETDKIKILKKN